MSLAKQLKQKNNAKVKIIFNKSAEDFPGNHSTELRTPHDARYAIILWALRNLHGLQHSKMHYGAREKDLLVDAGTEGHISPRGP